MQCSRPTEARHELGSTDAARKLAEDALLSERVELEKLRGAHQHAQAELQARASDLEAQSAAARDAAVQMQALTQEVCVPNPACGVRPDQQLLCVCARARGVCVCVLFVC